MVHDYLGSFRPQAPQLGKWPTPLTPPLLSGTAIAHGKIQLLTFHRARRPLRISTNDTVSRYTLVSRIRYSKVAQ
jgi:hypothetical protein